MLSKFKSFIVAYHFWISGTLLICCTAFFLFKIAGFWMFPYINYTLNISGCILLFLFTLLISQKPRWLMYIYYSFCLLSIIVNSIATASSENFSSWNSYMTLPVLAYLFILLYHLSSRKERAKKQVLVILLSLIFGLFILSNFIHGLPIKVLFSLTILGFLMLFYLSKNQSSEKRTITDNA